MIICQGCWPVWGSGCVAEHVAPTIRCGSITGVEGEAMSPEESSLLGRIAERRALLAEQAERLGKELADIQAELERVMAAEQVVAQLLAEQDGAAGSGAEHSAGAFDRSAVPSAEASTRVTPGRPPGPALLIPHWRDVPGNDRDGSALPADYRRILQVVAQAGEPVQCKTVCQAVGAGTEPVRFPP